MEVLSEGQFLKAEYSSSEALENFSCIGEYYLRQSASIQKLNVVQLPKGSPDLIFRESDPEIINSYEGPFTFLDIAKRISRELKGAGEDVSSLLPHRLILEASS